MTPPTNAGGDLGASLSSLADCWPWLTVVARIRSPSGLRLTLFGHPHFKALLEAAVLTAVPRHLVDDAVLVAVTRVDHVLLDASAEKPLQTQTEQTGRR